jgi:hypothetical protein
VCYATAAVLMWWTWQVQLRESMERGQPKDRSGAATREEELSQRLQAAEARLKGKEEELEALRAAESARGAVVLLGGEQSAHNPLHPEQGVGALPPGVVVGAGATQDAPGVKAKACCAVQ